MLQTNYFYIYNMSDKANACMNTCSSRLVLILTIDVIIIGSSGIYLRTDNTSFLPGLY